MLSADDSACISAAKLSSHASISHNIKTSDYKLHLNSCNSMFCWHFCGCSFGRHHQPRRCCRSGIYAYDSRLLPVWKHDGPLRVSDAILLRPKPRRSHPWRGQSRFIDCPSALLIFVCAVYGFVLSCRAELIVLLWTTSMCSASWLTSWNLMVVTFQVYLV